MYGGIKTGKYATCLAQTSHWFESKRYKVCNSMLQLFCSESKIRIFKTIRHSMAFFEEFLETVPSMKIIHLVRDPRATLQSQILVAKFPMDDLKLAARQHCERVFEDIKTFNRIKEKHPVSIVRIYYEDLAEDPIDMAHKMYDFLGMDYTEHLIEYIKDITSNGLPDGCNICPQRADSREHIDKWRTRMTYTRARDIDTQCSGVYDRLRYIPVISELALKTLQYPLIKKQNAT